MPDSVPGFLDQDHRGSLEGRQGSPEHTLQFGNYMSGTGVVEPKGEHGDGTTVGEGGDLAEIEVEPQQDTCFTGSLLENLAVREAMQVLIAEMDRVMSVLVEPLHHPRSTPMSARKRPALRYDARTSSCANQAA
jgi:hypothetical protein